MGLPRGASGKESACQWQRHKRCGFDPWVRKIPWRRKWQPTLVFFPEKSRGQRSLVGYSPRGHKESDITECMHTHTHTHTHTHKLSYIPFIKVKGTLVIQLRPTLCNPLDYTSVYGILQAKILELVSIFFSRGSSQPRDSTQVSCIAYKFFTVWTTMEDPFFKWWSIILLLLNMSGFRDLLLSSRMWRE